jgi:hypothetical protein
MTPFVDRTGGAELHDLATRRSSLGDPPVTREDLSSSRLELDRTEYRTVWYIRCITGIKDHQGASRLCLAARRPRTETHARERAACSDA